MLCQKNNTREKEKWRSKEKLAHQPVDYPTRSSRSVKSDYKTYLGDGGAEAAAQQARQHQHEEEHDASKTGRPSTLQLCLGVTGEVHRPTLEPDFQIERHTSSI